MYVNKEWHTFSIVKCSFVYFYFFAILDYIVVFFFLLWPIVVRIGPINNSIIINCWTYAVLFSFFTFCSSASPSLAQLVRVAMELLNHIQCIKTMWELIAIKIPIFYRLFHKIQATNVYRCIVPCCFVNR